MIEAINEEFSAQLIDIIQREHIEEINYTNPYQTKRLIVKTTANTTTLNAIDIAKNDEYYILQFSNEEEAKPAFEYYKNLSEVEHVEPDHIFKTTSTDTIYETWGAREMDISNYDQYLGHTVSDNNLKEVIIVVLDTGIDTDHEWFTNRIYPGGKNYS